MTPGIKKRFMTFNKEQQSLSKALRLFNLRRGAPSDAPLYCMAGALPAQLVLHEGVYEKGFMKKDSDTEVLYNPRMYSYAYIHGPFSEYPNFSYTFDMKD